MMTLREINLDVDHPVLAVWWEAHKWPVVPRSVLPKLGVVTLDGDLRVAAAFLYMDNSVGVCWLEWLVTNPDATGRQSLAGIAAVTEFLAERALEMNYGVMFTTCRQPALARIYERHGFGRTDEGVIHLVRKLRE
jgi:hypothetical protein